MKRIRPNLFKRGESYVYRAQEDGQDRWITIGKVTQRQAIDVVAELKQARALEKSGAGDRKRISSKFVFIREILDFYRTANFPRADGRQRSHRGIYNNKRYAEWLIEGIGNCRIDEFNSSNWNSYTASAVKEKRGIVALDQEMILLRTAWKYCTRFPNETGITDTPSFSWHQNLRHKSEVYHCRSRQPDNAEQLHEMSAYFFKQRIKYAVMGWYILFQAMIGCRRSELLRLRLDAKTADTPGFDDGQHLWLYRSKTHKGTSPFIAVHPDLRELLKAHRTWISEAYPGSPWYFPSVIKRTDPQAMNPQSISSAFSRLRKATGIDKSSHGLRSYYINVRRSQGASDGQIALEVGHKNAHMIVETYGEVLPVKLDWTPKGPPAWERWAGKQPISRPAFG